VSNGWTQNAPFDKACRRAGGRRHYNAWRHIHAELRRAQVAELLGVYGLSHGAQARIAECLGVTRSTVCRDVHALFAGTSRGVFLPYYRKGWTVAELARAYRLPPSVVRVALDRDLARHCFRSYYGEPAKSYGEIAAELRLSVPAVRRYVRQGEADALEDYRRYALRDAAEQ
jgi:hypothetical protein